MLVKLGFTTSRTAAVTVVGSRTKRGMIELSSKVVLEFLDMDSAKERRSSRLNVSVNRTVINSFPTLRHNKESHQLDIETFPQNTYKDESCRMSVVRVYLVAQLW